MFGWVGCLCCDCLVVVWLFADWLLVGIVGCARFVG